METSITGILKKITVSAARGSEGIDKATLEFAVEIPEYSNELVKLVGDVDYHVKFLIAGGAQSYCTAKVTIAKEREAKLVLIATTTDIVCKITDGEFTDDFLMENSKKAFKTMSQTCELRTEFRLAMMISDGQQEREV